MALNPVRLEGQCPKDCGDLVYDVAARVYRCQTCDYQRMTLQPEPRELVLAAPTITLAEVAKRWGITVPGVAQYAQRHAVECDGAAADTTITAADLARLEKLRAAPKNNGWRTAESEKFRRQKTDQVAQAGGALVPATPAKEVPVARRVRRPSALRLALEEIRHRAGDPDAHAHTLDVVEALASFALKLDDTGDLAGTPQRSREG